MAAVQPLRRPFAVRPEQNRRFCRIRELAGRVAAPAALKRLASMPLTIAGAALFDWGVFTVSVTAGLMVAGLTLLGIEYLIADED